MNRKLRPWEAKIAALTAPEAKVLQHVPDEDGRCIICGWQGVSPSEPCPGVAAEEEESGFTPVSDSFLPASQEYDPWRELDDFCEAFTHDPDKASFNVLCPVCGGRPCFYDCKLGPWTLEEINALCNSLPPLTPEG